MDTETTDYMPPAPKGYAFRVFAPDWFQRDFVPRWLRPLTVYLYKDDYYARHFGEPTFYSTISPNATARNNPGSVRRAAQRALERYYAEERKKEKARIHAESAKGQTQAAKRRTKDQQRLAEKKRKDAVKAAEYAAFVGTYPPKKLTDRK